MAHLDEHSIRIEKLNKLTQAKINCFPEKYNRTHNTDDLKEEENKGNLNTAEHLTENGATNKYKIAGRIMSYRSHGKISFAKLQDLQGTIQICFVNEKIKLSNNGQISEKINIDGQEYGIYKFVEKFIDTGDIVGVSGELFMTKHNELTLFVSETELLTKSLNPLPEKWHGIQDEEIRLRKRYLDIITNEDTKNMVLRRSKFWNAMRSFLIERGFIEVETPILEHTTGGADANPFATHYNALDVDVYLRISCGELWQKRLMVAGLEKTFEIGRIFRNEGMSPEHAQDYTQMEIYWAYTDYQDMMRLMKEMYLNIVDTVYKTRKFNIRGFEVDFDKEWEIIDYTNIIKSRTGIDIFNSTDEEIENKLKELNVKYEAGNRPRMIDYLWKSIRKTLSGPAFLVNEPKFTSPLAKSDMTNPELTHRFHIIIAGSEVGNGYSELNDPIDQKERFEEQQNLRDAGDDEAQMADWDFVDALMHGMPPTSGFGISERLFCFLEDKPIRETQTFPFMKPENLEVAENGKSKDTKIAVAIINKGVNMLPWQEMNTIAHLNSAFGARMGKSLFLQDHITTADNENIKLNIQHAIMIKNSENQSRIIELIKKAKEEGLEISEFIREMVETSDDKKIIKTMKEKNYDKVEYLGVLVFGNKKKVEELTKEFGMYGE